MAIALPTAPGIRSARARMIDFGGNLTPALGGPVQRLNRLGTRFAIDVTMPPIKAEPDGRIFLSRLRRAMAEGALMRWPQDGLAIGAPGAPLVNGAGQTGTTLVLDGFTPGYLVREGQFFSIIHGGRRYLHSANADVIANGSGQATLSIFPMLRISPSDNAVCEFAQPMIEGLLSGNEVGWDIDLIPYYGLSFSVTEAE